MIIDIKSIVKSNSPIDARSVPSNSPTPITLTSSTVKKKFGKLSHIKPAPKRQTLKVFGGALDINEFRSNSIVDKVEDKLDINEKSENDVIVPIVSNTKKMYEIKSASGTNEQLRLKREKPLKRDQNNLESVLGLVIKPK